MSPQDSPFSHAQDTIAAGAGLVDPVMALLIATEGPDRVADLLNIGVPFDTNADGSLSLSLEAAHTHPRVARVAGDLAGREIMSSLIKATRTSDYISVIEGVAATALLQHGDGRIGGVFANNGTPIRYEADETVFATGGSGGLFAVTTNPVEAAGQGLAMAARCGALIGDAEFVQFHPTAMDIGKDPAPLATEALRGEGATLVNRDGKPFMSRYHEMGDLAPRDIVARAIDNEMKRTGTEYVYLDCRHMDKEKFIHHFPNIYQKCLSIGIDVMQHMIPVAPAAHYSCGGIKTDEWGKTSIQHLYACGECASTGLHGANRLASNSLLEAMVFGHRCFLDSSKMINKINFETNIPDWNTTGTTEPSEMILITQSQKELRQIMSDYVGIVRTDVRLERAMKRLDLLFAETEALYKSTKVSPQLCELRNVITVGYLIVKGAEFRKESRGLHYNTDHLQKSERLQNIIL